MMKLIKKIAASCMAALTVMLCACNNNTNNTGGTESETSAEYAAMMHEASTTPYGKYPELITYTLGKLTGSKNSNMPYGDTYENNAYTRFLREMLNIQNEDVFEDMDEQYDSNVSMAVATENMPDIMIVSNKEDLQLLIESDMLADLTEVYENCMSDTIKEIYASYGSDILDLVTFDGKIMAIPETNIEEGANLVWLRKDWMDKLGLEAPKTLGDVEYIVSQFIEKDPGGNGLGNTIGLVCDSSLCGGCGYSSEYMLDIIFASYGAYPKQWIYNENGEVVYGSVQPEAKEALAHINELYESGIIDKNFLLRTSSNIIELIVNGECGSFFGPWWAPNNPLMEAVEVNPDAEWVPYLIATDEDGSTSYYSKNPSYKYVVVRKDYEHPEIACKIISVLFDYIRYEEGNNEEFIKYFMTNVDPTARPLAINVDYSDALDICYESITSVLEGKKEESELPLLEYSYYKACKAYLENPDTAKPEEWAAYASRITACKLLYEGNLKVVESLFFDETATMAGEWWKLEDVETQTYLQIVTGEKPIEQFDVFVQSWYEGGGAEITEEVAEAISK